MGFSQAEVSKIAEAFASNTTPFGARSTGGKPRVIWVHGAECTGCSTSLLGILESPAGHPLPTVMPTVTTGAALGLANVTPTAHVTVGGVAQTAAPFTLWTNTGVNAIEGSALVNIADVVIDVIDLQYHETVMGMGGDLAAQWLNDFANYVPGTTPGSLGEDPFVLVVEGALQDKTQGGAWNDMSDPTVPWCSIGCSDNFNHAPAAGFEIDMPDVVEALAVKSTCVAIIPIGQCAAFGGYPGCKPPVSAAVGGWTTTMSMTGAMGVGAYLTRPGSTSSAAAGKVINVPGCPTNPWWFVLTVVLFMADFAQNGTLGILLPHRRTLRTRLLLTPRVA